MSETALIARDDAKLAVSFTEAANQMREVALSTAALVGRVTTADEQAAAVQAQTELQLVLKLAEDARVACKAPVLDFGRKIDGAAQDFVKELKAELLRVSALVGDFQQLEQAKARAAEQARNERLSALEREKAEALSQATSHEQADAIHEHYNNRAAVEAAPPPEPIRAPGQIVKQDWDIAVSNPYELARVHPHCVKITPLLSEIKQLLNDGITVRGVTATKITKASVRLPKEQPAITV